MAETADEEATEVKAARAVGLVEQVGMGQLLESSSVKAARWVVAAVLVAPERRAAGWEWVAATVATVMEAARKVAASSSEQVHSWCSEEGCQGQVGRGERRPS